MFMALILFLCAIYCVLVGVPMILDPRTVMDQIYAAVHMIGALLMCGLGIILMNQVKIMKHHGIIKKKEKIKVNIINDDKTKS